jgi:hypothetical protein
MDTTRLVSGRPEVVNGDEISRESTDDMRGRRSNCEAAKPSRANGIRRFCTGRDIGEEAETANPGCGALTCESLLIRICRSVVP